MTTVRILALMGLVSSLLLSCSGTGTDMGSGAGEWSRFRGPNGSGVSSTVGLPVDLGPDENVDWKVSVPFGRSSPVISRERVFLTAVEDGKLITMGFDRGSGEELWRREWERAEVADFHHDTDSATPTPVTDGTNVYVFFQEAGLVSYDSAGNERWKLPLGPFRNFYGMASSPVLAGRTLVLVCDQAEGSFIVAVDRDTGKEVWRRNRPARLESYSTPVLYPDGVHPQRVLVNGSRWVDAYDLTTGDDVWSLGGLGSGPIASPVLAGGILLVNAPDHAEHGWAEFTGILAEHDQDKDGELSREDVAGVWLEEHFGWLDADASGAISAEDWARIGAEMVNDHWGVFAIDVPADGGEATIKWNYRRNVAHIPSSLVHDGVFYMVDDGIVTSLDLETGALLKRGRLGNGSPKVYASLVAADGKLYIGTLEGQMVVLELGDEWTVLKTNELGEEIWASPAIAGGHLYLRTRGTLYSFSSRT